MDLVIDANVLISALISPQGHTADLFFLEGLYFHAPEFILEEIEEHKTELLKKTGLSEIKFNKLLSSLKLYIRFVPIMDFLAFVSTAKQISPDSDDVAYLAVALSLSCPLWSNDKALKSQKEVKVFSTSELLQFLS